MPLTHRVNSLKSRYTTLFAVIILVGLLLVQFAVAGSSNHYPGKTWDVVEKPEELGWSSKKLADAMVYSWDIGTTAFVIVYQGKILYQWGEVDVRSNIHSARKSLISAIYGIAVDEGKIDISMKLDDLGIDDNAPSLSDIEKQSKVEYLLKARSGIYHPALYETRGMAARRPVRGTHLPGTFWYYNNWDFNALATIFEMETGKGVFHFFQERIANPLEMQDFRLQDCTYARGSDSIHAAYPFRLTARDMARFGLLFARNGKWKDKQIISEKWIKQSTYPYSKNKYSGYAYMWWCDKLRNIPIRHFSAEGVGYQMIAVFPDIDLVLVNRVNTDDDYHEPKSSEMRKLVKMIFDAHKTGFDFAQ
jgi:CubicO group peptidase (beta-lactamase class C family)